MIYVQLLHFFCSRHCNRYLYSVFKNLYSVNIFITYSVQAMQNYCFAHFTDEATKFREICTNETSQKLIKPDLKTCLLSSTYILLWNNIAISSPSLFLSLSLCSYLSQNVWSNRPNNATGQDKKAELGPGGGWRGVVRGAGSGSASSVSQLFPRACLAWFSFI